MRKAIFLSIFLLLLVSLLFACNKTQYIISFDSNGGTEVSSIATDGKSVIKMPSEPTKKGFVFDGWYYDNGLFRRRFKNSSLVDNHINGNLTVYAKWKEELIASQGLEYQFDEDSFIVVGYNGNSEDLVIADMHNGYPVRKIVSGAFENKNVVTVTISESIKEIGAGVFKGCKNIKKMVLPFVGKNRENNLCKESVFGYIFGSSSTLALLPVMTTEQSYDTDKSLFYFVPSSLKEVVITDATIIPYGAFSNLVNIKRVIFDNRIENIGQKAFYNCNKLEAIYLSSNVKNVASQAFVQCKNIVVYCQPESAPSNWSSNWKDENTLIYWGVGVNDFFYREGLYFVIYKEEIVITRYTGEAEEVRVPSSISDLTIRAIMKKTFENSGSLKRLFIPSSVKLMERNTIIACNNLEILELPFVGRTEDDQENNYLGYIFGASSSTMNNDYVPSKLRKVSVIKGAIKANAFAECKSIEEVELLNNVESIGLSCFKNCKNLKTVIVSKNILKLSESAFSGCSSLENIQLPSAITVIEKSVFENCHNLISIEIPQNIESIEEKVFSGCIGLEEIVFSNKIRNIGGNAFAGCTNLRVVNLPNSVERIENYAFSSCLALKDINISSKVVYVGDWAFQNCISLSTIIIPQNVITIGSHAFVDCENLTIYCQAKAKPSGFREQWNGGRPVVWDYQI